MTLEPIFSAQPHIFKRCQTSPLLRALQKVEHLTPKSGKSGHEMQALP